MSFKADIKRLTDQYQKRARAVYRQSVQDVVNDAQKTRDEGGRMRVDTGFLRSSGGAALNKTPRGPTSQDDAVEAGSSQTGDNLILILGRWSPGDSVTWGWTANYARIRESKDGFMRGAVENWGSIVDENARKAKSRGL